MSDLNKLNRYVKFQIKNLQIQLQLISEDYVKELLGSCNRSQLHYILDVKRNIEVEMYYLSAGRYDKIIGFQNSLNRFETYDCALPEC